MSYMVMETSPAFAVVLDQSGRFLKAANLSYAVGDVIDEIVPLRAPAQAKGLSARGRLMSLLAAAACFAALIFGAYQQNFAACGTVRLRINPDVLLTASRTERVLRLEGLNADGGALIAGYEYRGRSQDVVTAELVQRAADMGYVSDGGQVSITLSGDAKWQSAAEMDIVSRLQSSVDTVAVTVYLSSAGETEPHSAVPTAPESGYWSDHETGQLPALSFPQLGDELGRLGTETGEQLGQWGRQTGEQLWQWGRQTGEQLEQWGRQTGERFEQWGQQAGQQLEDTVGSGQYWADIIQGGISSGDVSGIVNDIIGIF